MTTESGLENLPAALGLAAFERTPAGLFRPLGTLPPWLVSSESEIDLAARFPLLELFLSDCEPVFATGNPSRLESDVWEEAEAEGTRYLQAEALRLGARNLLMLRSLSRDRFTYQQLYHDFQLAEEEARRLKDVAERATRAKSDFLATMSHEIRTPLNAIIGMADVLSASPLTPEQQKCVEVFQRNGVSLLTLINDILDLAKVEAGKVELESIPFDLDEVLARATEVVEGRVKAKGLVLRSNVAQGVPRYLVGDPGRLRQIVLNLLGNSIKFTERGSLGIHVEQDLEDARPGCLRFAIADTGIGIPEENLGQLFQNFTQADSSTTRKYGGTGLGLSISRQLVELMGGRIWVASKAGWGSTFFFTVKLAVQADQLPRAAAVAPTAGIERSADGLRILLADDSADNRFLILSYLKKADCSIEIAENGQQASEAFRTGHFDVVLMDIEMPVMDGYSAVRAIRAYERDSRKPATPVIALTAHAFAQIAEKSREAGFTSHLLKPIRKATLVEALAKYSSKVHPIGETPSPAPASDEFVVRMEDGMEDVVPGYLAKRRGDVESYRHALATGDFDALRMLGHKMKGTGAGYGFPALTEIGGAIEKGALAKDGAKVAAEVERLASYLGRVRLEPAP